MNAPDTPRDSTATLRVAERAVATRQRGSQTEAFQRAHVVEQILDRVIPTWRSNDRPNKDANWTYLRDRAARAKGLLGREEELHEIAR